MDISSLTEVVNQWLAAQTKLPDGTVISIKLTTFGAKVGVLKPAEVYLKAEDRKSVV